jgi:YggT family protein
MSPVIETLLVATLYIMLGIVVASAIATWIPSFRSGQVGAALHQLSEPMLAPFRQLLPRTGMFDFSGLVVIVLINVMIYVVGRAADQ